MSTFAFEVSDAVSIKGLKGDATLIGPPSHDGTLQTGDYLTVCTANGREVMVECVDFPLINLGGDRTDWVRVSVRGIAPDDVQIGSIASRTIT